MTKAQRTTRYILQTVAPIFNKKGYAATSLGDITTATGLTKGGIYGNFTSKEDLAQMATEYNLKLLLQKLEEQLDDQSAPLQKLFVINHFYRYYNDHVAEIGGCPIQQFGMDALHLNEMQQRRVRLTAIRIMEIIGQLIEEGQQQGEIKPVDASLYAKRIFSILNGGIILNAIMNDEAYLKDAVNLVESVIVNELKQ